MADAGLLELTDATIETLDFDPSCDWRAGRCDQKATWEGVCECCAFMAALHCDEHKTALDALMRRRGRHRHFLCGRVCGGMVWSPLAQ